MNARVSARMWVQRSGWLLVPAVGLVLVLNFWCQLHGSALGHGPVSFDVSVPWALKSALGWMTAGLLLWHLGPRLLASRFAARHEWPARALLVAGVGTVTLTNELLLLADGSAKLWLYERGPLHLTFGALLVGGWLMLRARGRGGVQPAAPAPAPLVPAPAAPQFVDVMTGTGRARVRLDEIECLEADRNYISVHTPQRSYLLRQTLSSFERTLSPRDFLRIHRSTIVNRAMILERRRGGMLVMRSGRVLRVSRAFTHVLN